MILTETRTTSYYSYQSEGCVVILSGTKQNCYAGVGAIVSPRLRPHLQDVLQVSPRLLRLTFGQQGGSFHIVGAYAPHAGLDFEEERSPFWETLETHLGKTPQPEPVDLTGDLNVRFQARHRKDQGLLGPFVYGKGTHAIDHSDSSNRTLCLNLMKPENMVEVCSCRTPCLKQQITYRDKAASPPPQDWSQSVLDPLALQQFYTKSSQIARPQALEIAFRIRSFLDIPSLLAPPTIPPQVDPIRFQKLDHTLRRRQWLNSIKSCRSILRCGFASDHYPLVTEISVKLAKCPRRNPNPKPYQVLAPTAEQTQAFEDALKGGSPSVLDSPPPPDHTTKHFTRMVQAAVVNARQAPPQDGVSVLSCRIPGRTFLDPSPRTLITPDIVELQWDRTTQENSRLSSKQRL